MPLQRRVPKRGFRNPRKDVPVIVNLGQLEIFDAGSEVTPETMRTRGLVRGNGRFKILGEGRLTKSLTVKAHGFSAKAKETIEALGGKAELIAPHD
jgi:large subunit ribosomal protein L15